MILSHALRAVSKASAADMEYISTSNYTSVVASTSHSVPSPSTYNAGDLIAIFIASGSDQALSLTDSGWTTVVNTYNSTADNTMYVAYRTAGTEPANYTLTQASSRGLVAVCVVLRNAIYNTYETSVSSGASSIPVSVTPFNSLTDGLIYYTALSRSSNLTISAPSGYTEIAELYTSATFSNVNLQISYIVPNNGTSTTNVSSTWSTSGRIQGALFDFKRS